MDAWTDGTAKLLQCFYNQWILYFQSTVMLVIDWRLNQSPRKFYQAHMDLLNLYHIAFGEDSYIVISIK